MLEDRIPEEWERYFTGETVTLPEGFEGIQEQLELYGVLPAEKGVPARRRHAGRQAVDVGQPVAAPGPEYERSPMGLPA